MKSLPNLFVLVPALLFLLAPQSKADDRDVIHPEHEKEKSENNNQKRNEILKRPPMKKIIRIPDPGPNSSNPTSNPASNPNTTMDPSPQYSSPVNAQPNPSQLPNSQNTNSQNMPASVYQQGQTIPTDQPWYDRMDPSLGNANYSNPNNGSAVSNNPPISAPRNNSNVGASSNSSNNGPPPGNTGGGANTTSPGNVPNASNTPPAPGKGRRYND